MSRRQLAIGNSVIYFFVGIGIGGVYTLLERVHPFIQYSVSICLFLYALLILWKHDLIVKKYFEMVDDK